MNEDIRLAYRENTTRLITRVGRVVLLYEQLIQDIGKAIAAVHGGQVEARTQSLNHALLVLGLLQGSLDLEQGGEVARNLDRFYALVRARLMDAQLTASASILEGQRALLLSLRAAWVEVEQAEDRQSESTAVLPAAGAAPAPAGERKNWRA